MHAFYDTALDDRLYPRVTDVSIRDVKTSLRDAKKGPLNREVARGE